MSVQLATGGSVRVVRETATRLRLTNVYVTGRSGTRLLLVMTEPELLALVRELLAAGDNKAGDAAEERAMLKRYAEGGR